jgi:hypothetical protein
VLVVNFLLVTGRRDILEPVHEIAYIWIGWIFAGVAGMCVVVGFFTSFDGDPAFATAYYIAAGISGFCWLPMSAMTYAAQEFAAVKYS